MIQKTYNKNVSYGEPTGANQNLGFKDLQVGHRVRVEVKQREDGAIEAEEVTLETGDDAPADHAKIAGLIRSINYENNTLRLLSRDFVVPDGISVQDLQRNILRLTDLKAGDRVKLKGKYSTREGFVPEKITLMKGNAGLTAGMLQGAINRMDREKRMFDLLGFKVIVDEKATRFETKKLIAKGEHYEEFSRYWQKFEKVDLSDLNATDKFYLDGGFKYKPAKGRAFIINRTTLAKESGSLLDLGCGDGFWSFILAEWYEVTGEDLSKGGIYMARKKALEHNLKIDFVLTDSLLEEKRYDVVFTRAPSFFSARPVDHPDFRKGLEVVFRRAKRMLVYVTFSQPPFKTYNKAKTSYYHDPEELQTVFSKYGKTTVSFKEDYIVCEAIL